MDFTKSVSTGTRSGCLSGLAHRAFGTLFGAWLTTLSLSANSTEFIDVSKSVGIDYSGSGYAVAAADVNNDGWPDIAVSRHESVVLLVNRKGTFETIELERRRDSHGLSWLDWNNDGHLDLYVSRGGRRGRSGSWPNALYLNDGTGQLAEAVDVESLRNEDGRGRSALPFDHNNDGLTDLIITNFSQAALIATQNGGGDHPEVILSEQLSGGLNGLVLGGQTIFISQGHSPEFLQYSGGGMFSRQPLPIVGTAMLGKTSHSVIADFDNDLLADVYFAQAQPNSEAVEQIDRQIFFRFDRNTTLDDTLRFATRHAFQITLWTEGALRNSRLILPSGLVASTFPQRINGGLAAQDYVGPPSSGDVVLSQNGNEFELHAPLGVQMQSVSGHIQLFGAGQLLYPTSESDHVPNLLTLQRSAQLLIQPHDAPPADTSDALASDFDNDGDIDLYLINGGVGFQNPPNTYFENLGAGQLVVADAGIDAKGSRFGRGCCSVSLDYDRDGDLDIFLNNGAGPKPGNAGPEQLLRNHSSPQNWLQVELRNAEAGLPFGAQVVVRTKSTAQLRQVTAGNGRMATHWLPSHFGLGDHDRADVEVHWPDGTLTLHPDVEANQRITIER